MNFASGFWSGKSGVAFHTAWLTRSDIDVHGTDWVISSDSYKTYRSNGISRVINDVGTSSSLQSLAINSYDNYYNSPEHSDFMIADIIIFNTQLSSSQITTIENYLMTIYQYSSPTLIPSIPPSFSPTYVPGLPTPLPTHRHTHKPTSSPTLVPSSSPTLPTSSPTPEPTSIPVRYTITLCGANCSPWDYISFPDQTANWIWNDGNARSVAAANEYIQFNKDFTSSSSYTGTVYANCDDNCYVYFNNQLVAHQGGWNNRLIANVNVVVGSNTIIIVAWNDGYNPAGLIASLHNPSNNAVVHTDNSWIWSRVSSSTSFVPSVSTPQPTNSPTLMPSSSPTLPTTSLMNTKGKIDRKGIAINGTTSAFLDISVSNNGNFILYSTKEKLLLSSNYGNSFTSMGWPSSADYSSSSTSITNDGIIYVSSSGNNYAYINGAWISFSTTYCKLPFQSPDTGKSMVLVCDRDWTVYVVKLEWNSLTSSSAFSWNGLHSMGGESIGPITSSSNMDSFLVATSHTFVDYNCGGPGYLYLSSFGSSWSRLTNIFQAGLNRDYFASVSMSSDGKVMIASSIRGKKVWNCNSIYDVGSALETGHIYGSSNYGKDWKRIDPNWEFWTGGDYKSVSCNDDCSVIMATAESDTQNYLMVSSNFGLDWTIDNTTLRSNKVAGTRSSISSFYSFEYNVAYSVNFTGPSMQPTLEPSSSPTRGKFLFPLSSLLLLIDNLHCRSNSDAYFIAYTTDNINSNVCLYWSPSNLYSTCRYFYNTRRSIWC